MSMKNNSIDINSFIYFMLYQVMTDCIRKMKLGQSLITIMLD